MDLAELEKEFMLKKYKIVSDFVMSKLEYWKQLPKLCFIREGKTGYGSDRTLMSDKLYKVNDHNNIFIDCRSGKLLCGTYDYSSGNVDIYYGLEHWQMGDWILSMGVNTSNIDGEERVEYYNNEINRSKYSTVSQVIYPAEWVATAVQYDIDLKYEDYCRHFDNPEHPQFDMSEKEFDKLLEDTIVAEAVEVLL